MPIFSADPSEGITATGLWKSYGSTDAVSGIDLAIAPGETVALLGPNGAGKTTTIDMILGLEGVHVETMKGLQDLRSLSQAPALQQLLLIDMSRLELGDLNCLVGHPTLKEVTVGTGSRRRNEAGTALLGLPRVQFSKGRWRPLVCPD